MAFSQPVFGFSGKLGFYYEVCPAGLEFYEFNNEKYSGQLKVAFSAALRYQFKKEYAKIRVSVFAEGGVYGSYSYDFSTKKTETNIGPYGRAVAEISINKKVFKRFQRSWNKR